MIDRLRRRDLLFHPAAITLAGFMLAFGAVYLAGYFDLTDRAALSYWLKGIGTWAIHFTYLILGVAHMVRRGRAALPAGDLRVHGGARRQLRLRRHPARRSRSPPASTSTGSWSAR